LSPESIIAGCAAVIALAAAVVSTEQMRVTRLHNRKSLRPILRFRSGHVGPGDTVGLHLRNVGLGPAVVLTTQIWLDGDSLGSFSPETAARIQEEFPQLRIRTVTVSDAVLEHQFAENLISIEDFDRERSSHRDFDALIHERLRLTIVYDSVYGGERFVAEFP
jgi:hypothetical protein